MFTEALDNAEHNAVELNCVATGRLTDLIGCIAARETLARAQVRQAQIISRLWQFCAMKRSQASALA